MELQINRNSFIFKLYTFIIPSYRIKSEYIPLCKLCWVSLLGLIILLAFYCGIIIYHIIFYIVQTLCLIFHAIFLFEYPLHFPEYFTSYCGYEADTMYKYYHTTFTSPVFITKYLNCSDFKLRPIIFLFPLLMYMLYEYVLNPALHDVVYPYMNGIISVYFIIYFIHFLFKSKIIDISTDVEVRPIFLDDETIVKKNVTIYNIIPYMIKSTYRKLCPLVKIKE